MMHWYHINIVCTATRTVIGNDLVISPLRNLCAIKKKYKILLILAFKNKDSAKEETIERNPGCLVINPVA